MGKSWGDGQSAVVSILVPIYNEARWIGAALNSIRNQTFPDFKVAIYDNASTDSTPDICKEVCSIDNRFVYLRHEKNLGSVENARRLLEDCDTKFFMILGSHDRLEQEFLNTHVAFLQRNPGYALSYGNITNIDVNNEVIGRFEPPDYGPLITAKSPAKRYVQALKRIPKGVLVNHVFRRSSVEPAIFLPVTGADHVFIAFTAGAGKWKKHENALYNRRCFEKRDQNYIQRVTGKAGKKNRSDYDMVKHMVWVLYEYFDINIFQKVVYSVYLVAAVSWKLFKIRKLRKLVHMSRSFGKDVLRKLPCLNGFYIMYLKKYIYKS